MDGEPIFHGPLLGRRNTPLILRRALVFGLTASAYLAAALALAAVNLLIVETLPPPRAVSGVNVGFVTPPPLPGGQGGGPVQPSTVAATRAAAPAAAHSLQVPAPRPTVVPLPPPTDPDPELDHSDTPGTTLEDSGAPGMDSTGVRGPGGGIGVGPGGSAGGGNAEDGRGTGSGGDVVYDEGRSDITPPVQRATRAFPRYPELARKAGVEGSVVLLIVIDREGRVGEIEVLRAPDPRFGFDLAAIEAVKQWRYQPALLGGRPVAVQASVTIEFTISR
jgi:periplasmic protein TonB